MVENVEGSRTKKRTQRKVRGRGARGAEDGEGCGVARKIQQPSCGFDGKRYSVGKVCDVDSTDAGVRRRCSSNKKHELLVKGLVRAGKALFENC